jgi:hypothetical protein
MRYQLSDPPRRVLFCALSPPAMSNTSHSSALAPDLVSGDARRSRPSIALGGPMQGFLKAPGGLPRVGPKAKRLSIISRVNIGKWRLGIAWTSLREMRAHGHPSRRYPRKMRLAEDREGGEGERKVPIDRAAPPASFRIVSIRRPATRIVRLRNTDVHLVIEQSPAAMSANVFAGWPVPVAQPLGTVRTLYTYTNQRVKGFHARISTRFRCCGRGQSLSGILPGNATGAKPRRHLNRTRGSSAAPVPLVDRHAPRDQRRIIDHDAELAVAIERRRRVVLRAD